MEKITEQDVCVSALVNWWIIWYISEKCSIMRQKRLPTANRPPLVLPWNEIDGHSRCDMGILATQRGKEQARKSCY
jgi:hypothetical protein